MKQVRTAQGAVRKTEGNSEGQLGSVRKIHNGNNL